MTEYQQQQIDVLQEIACQLSLIREALDKGELTVQVSYGEIQVSGSIENVPRRYSI
jgi:hypothetical protein